VTAAELQEIRKNAGLTQVGLADRLEVTPRAVQHWEAGTRKVPKWVERELSR
jgi:DNA-binding transcriptional regulator YiaG